MSRTCLPAIQRVSFYCRRFGYAEGQFAVCEEVATRSLALPLSPGRDVAQVGRLAAGAVLDSAPGKRAEWPAGAAPGTAKPLLTRRRGPGIVAAMIPQSRTGAARRLAQAPALGGRGLPLAILVALCAAALSGCGSGEGSSSSVTGRPSSSSTAPTASTGTPSTASQGTTSVAAGAPATTSPGSGSAGSSPSQVRAEADAICAQRNHELAGAPESGESLAGTAKAAARRVAIEQHALMELSALTPPSESKVDWEKMITQTERTLAEAGKLASAARAGNASAVTRDMEKETSPDLRLLAAAARAHLRHCASIG